MTKIEYELKPNLTIAIPVVLVLLSFIMGGRSNKASNQGIAKLDSLESRNSHLIPIRKEK
jgi:hypothetical protein